MSITIQVDSSEHADTLWNMPLDHYPTGKDVGIDPTQKVLFIPTRPLTPEEFSAVQSGYPMWEVSLFRFPKKGHRFPGLASLLGSIARQHHYRVVHVMVEDEQAERAVDDLRPNYPSLEIQVSQLTTIN